MSVQVTHINNTLISPLKQWPAFSEDWILSLFTVLLFLSEYAFSIGFCCFRRQGKVNHCRIKSRQERGQTKYYLIDAVTFESLYNLITHYRQFPLRSSDFTQLLREPVPQPQSHEGKEWEGTRFSLSLSHFFLGWRGMAVGGAVHESTVKQLYTSSSHSALLVDF